MALGLVNQVTIITPEEKIDAVSGNLYLSEFSMYRRVHGLSVTQTFAVMKAQTSSERSSIVAKISGS